MTEYTLFYVSHKTSFPKFKNNENNLSNQAGMKLQIKSKRKQAGLHQTDREFCTKEPPTKQKGNLQNGIKYSPITHLTKGSYPKYSLKQI